jgi:hypothetical protein
MRREPAAWGELAGLLEIRPLSESLPAPTYDGHFASPFSAPFSTTLRVLRLEVRELRARRVILEADFRPQDLRMDGLPRADRNALSPGVILTLLDTKVGHDLRYPCSTFRRWDANLHAIALALEALRKVDRYGVTKRGEQYRGFAQLPAGNGTPSSERGAELVRLHGSLAEAIKRTHPDTGGDRDDFAAVLAYRESLGPQRAAS